MNTERQLPDWLIQGFEKHGWTQLPADFAHALFNKSEFNLELFCLKCFQEITYYRALGTVDGYHYISQSKGFIHTPERLEEYLSVVEKALQDLLDAE